MSLVGFQIVEVDSGSITLADSSGNEITIVNDGGIYRISQIGKVLNASGTVINPATEETLDSIKGTDGIKKITDPLPAGTNEIGRIRAYAYDDANNVAMAVADGATVPANTRQWLYAGVDEDTKARRLMLVEDESVTGLWRLATSGKVSVHLPPPPEGTTPVTVAADTPLDVNGTEVTSYTISDGKIFNVQQVVAGAEGDPTEKGSKIEIYYYNGTIELLFDRIYISGFTASVPYPDVSESRSGVEMVGDGSTKEIRIKRIRLSGSTQEVDTVIRGYEE